MWKKLIFDRSDTKSKSVGDYYDNFTDSYLETYGNVIQAFRPADTALLHSYIINSADLKDGQSILDAGCGVGGPAVAFAKKLKVSISGITISERQVALANEYIKSEKVSDTVNFTCGDFHELSKHYQRESFDRILFLESLGHGLDIKKVVAEAVPLLKKGGKIYIKDFFPFEIEDQKIREKHLKVIKNINKSYTYNVLDLNETIGLFRSSKLEIDFIRKFQFQDDITARSAFEEANNIDLFGELEEFRVAEWLELSFLKPEHELF